ncbi:mitochondrial import inner membrane translocase subunit TIM50-C-like [Anthonomus grandis grandis]|uniref:mitochondrial import inner membrane translocase subunit TIM50-C-like n=1 Tax=Anthonomus grandis grandis TaxID=2921223 RepID=UPI002165F251|nr:mitochondrial import inner membrane translocase subunit TIM50-C-like [Anthonomus grandis grandis]
MLLRQISRHLRASYKQLCPCRVPLLGPNHFSDISPNKPLINPAIEKGFKFDNNNDRATAIKNMKYSFLFLGLSFTTIGGYIIMEYGKPPRNDFGEVIEDEYSHLPMWQQYLYRASKEVQKFAVFIQEPSRDKLLPDPLPYPYYQPPYTLVLEFTDVLAHPEWTYQTGWRFKKRPGVDYFLENLAGLYEIVVYTSEPGMTIFPVIEALDSKGLISYKLVRDSTHFIEGHHVKNLNKLNRDLDKVIMIDWNSDSVKFNRDNHFVLNRWLGADEDSTLYELTGFLRAIAQTDIQDVREVIKFYKQFDDPLTVFKQKQAELLEAQQKRQEKSGGGAQPHEAVKRVFSTIL